MSRFVPVDRDTAYLLPPSVDEWLPNDHLARFVVEVIEQLDLRELTGQYAGRGSAAHHPAVLLGLLIYGYANGVHSSRKIERATYDSVAFRYVAANTHPDHDTLATFRRRFLTAVESLFVQVLLLAREMKLLKLGHIALDGTKIDANASKHKALSWGYANRIEVQLREEVQQLLTLAENSDRAAVPDGMDVPAEIARREDRLSAIAQAKAKIEQRAAERHAVEQQEFEVKTAKRQAQRKAGKKPRGKDPEPPAAGPKDSDQVNLTDEESRIMPASSGGFEQSYNAQAGVDVETMLSRPAADSPSPQTSDPVEQMAHCLSTQSGRALYKLRKQTVEPVFGIIKRVMGWRQMSMRGLAKAQGEWSLVTMAWNIKRLHVLRAA
ncbi:transposase [Pseudomonas sp. 1-7]|nr:transposase [Pseudomonas sp. 1-7]